MSKSACSSIPALLLLSALCTGLGACGDDAASSPGKKPAPTCGPGKYCVRPESCIEGQCRRIGTVCEKDDDCAVGYLCEQNACVEPCRSDIQCPQGENLYCDQATGRCREIPRRCQNVLDCSEGQVCIDNQCIAPPPCVDDESCHPGVCIEGRCYECREASDCIRSVDAGTAEEYLCQENRCIPFAGRCSAADPCPGGQLCQAGHCLEPPRCTADVDCFQEQGRYCFQEHCTDRCDPLARTGCPAGWRCQEDGRCELVPCEESGCLEGLECREGICQPPKSCTEDPTICRGRQTCVGGSCTEPLVCESDADCLGERYCLEAWNTRSCTDPCLDENDCPGAKICHEVTHHCVDPQAICRSHDECLQGEVCEGGECRAQLPGECRNDGDCPRSERCIGTSCTLPPVPACVEDRQCPPGMVCGALEACEAPARCTADGQCPTGMKCNRGLARCAECVSDRDCGEGRSCEPLPGFDYFGCSEPPFCSKDEDCRGERTCNVRLAVCENPACAEDDSAPNHFPAMALPVTSRTIPGRMLCSGRDDWYRVTLEEGWGLVATLTTDPRGPDINVEIYEQADLVRPLARGSHIGGVEQATLGRAEVDGIYFIRVFAPLGFSVAYTLRVQVERAGACARDGMEGPRGNDDPLQAVRIGSGLYAGTICPGDVDHFTLELDEGLDLVVRLLPAAGVELTMALTREGTPVAEPVRTEQGLLLDLEGVQGGSYLVRLAGAAAQTEGSYRLQVYYPLSAAELLAICDDAQPLVPGTTAEGTTAEVGRVNGFTGSCDDDLPLGTEAVYLLDLAEDSEVSIDLSAGFDALLYLRQDCLDDAQEIFCEETTEQILRLRHLAAGSYYLVVDGQHAESGPFRLRVEASPSRLHPPANDSCQAPERLAFPDFAERSIAGTSVDALSNTALSCHPGTANGPDVVYALELGQDSRVTALLQTEGLSAALALTSGSCVRGEERACSFNDGLRQSLFFDLLPAGTYHLWVDGTSVVQQGRFTLTVRVEDPHEQLPGSSCAEPIELAQQERRFRYAGTSYGAPSSFAGATCAAGDSASAPDLVHHLVLDRPGLLVGQFRPEFDGVLALLAQQCLMAREIACTGSDFFSWPVDAGDYYLLVEGNDEEEMGDYLIDLEFVPIGVLPPDNDTCASPEVVTLRLGEQVELEGTLAGAAGNFESHSCGDLAGTRTGRDVVYSFELAEPAVLSADLAGGGDAVLYLHRANCESAQDLACGVGALPDTILQTGLYFLVVDAQSPGNQRDFLLLLQLAELPPERPANDRCSGARQLDLASGEVSIRATTAAAMDDYAGGECVGARFTAGSPDMVYRIDLLQPAVLEVEIDDAFDSVLYLTAGPCGSGNELGCNDDEELMVRRLPTGTYYLFVDGYQGDAGSFDLTVRRRALVLPPEDVCETAPLLAFDAAHHGEVSGSTAEMGDEYGGSCGGARAPDAVHRLLLPHRGRVRAALAPAFDARLHLHGVDCLGGPELACGTNSLVSPSLPAGTYNLVVDGSWEQARGDYRLSVDLDLARDNETCARAEQLIFDAGGHAEATGSSLAAANDYATACGGAQAGDVVYQLELDQPADLQARLVGAFAATLALLDADCDPGAPVGCSASSTINAASLAPGTYFLVADGLRAVDEGSFQLSVDILPIFEAPANDQCAAAASHVLALGETITLAGDTTHALDDTWRQGCGGLAGRDLFYRLTQQGSGQLQATFRGGFAARVYLLDSCDDAGFLACGSDQSRLASAVLPPGSRYLVVDANDAAEGGPFELDVHLAPINDSCERAYEIPISADGFGGLIASTSGGVSRFAEPRCGAGTAEAPERFFRFSLTELADLTVDFDPAFAGTAILLAGGCEQPQLLGCSADQIELANLPPDEYWLVVDGLAAGASGSFRVALAAEAPEAPDPLALKCAAPTELQFDADGFASAYGDSAVEQGLLSPNGCAFPGQAGLAPEVLYSFTLAQPARVDIALVSERPAALYVGHGLCTSLQEDACAAPADEGLLGLALGSGKHHLVVDGTTLAGPGAFELSLQLSAMNDLCSTALPLVLDAQGAGVIRGNSRLGMPSFRSQQCGAGSEVGSDLYYAFEVAAERPMDLSVSLMPGFDGAVALLGTGMCAEAPVLGCGRTLQQSRLGPGTYRLVVDDLGRPGSFLATVQLVPSSDLPVEPRQARCAAARPLAFQDGQAVAVGAGPLGESAFAPLSCPPQGPLQARLAAEDVHTFSLAVRSRLRVELHAARPAIVTLASGSCIDGQEIACGPGPSPWEVLTVPAGAYYLIVDGLAADGPGAYTLEVSAAPAPLTNGSCAQASAVSLVDGMAMLDDSTSGASSDFTSPRCGAGTQQGADLFYQLTLADWSTLEVELLADFAGAVALLSGGCDAPEVLACGPGFTTAALAPASYILVVDGLGAGEQGDFVLGLTAHEVPVDPLVQKCAEATDLVFADGVATTVGSTAGQLPVLVPEGCGGGAQGAVASAEVLYRFRLDGPRLVSAQVAAERPAVLYLAGGPCTQQDELACAVGSSLADRLLPAGTYHLVVDGAEAAGPGSFTLTLRASPLPDGCANPATLTFADGRGVAWGDTRLADPSFDSAQCPAGSAAGADLFFGFALPAPRHVQVTLSPGFAGAAALLGPGACAQAALRACGRDFRVDDLPAGDYWLVVDDLGQAGEFAATVQLIAPPPDPVALRCAEQGQLQLVDGRANAQGATSDDWSAFAPLSCPPTGPAEAYRSPEDVWAFSLAAPSLVSVALTAARPAIAYLGRGSCRQHEVVGCGHGTEPIDELILGAGEYVLLVDGEQPQGPGAYSLELRREQLPHNDSCAAASVVPLDAGAAQLHSSTAFSTPDFFQAACGAASAQGADAWYAVTVADRTSLQLALLATFEGVVALVRGDCAGAPEVVGCGAQLSTDPLPAGTYHLVVDGLGAQQQGEFWLSLEAVTVPPDPLEAKCAQAPALQLDGNGQAVVQGSADGASALLAPRLCADPGQAALSPELLYRFTLAAPALVDVTVAAERPAIVYLSDGDCTRPRELACAPAGGSLRNLVLPAGSYQLVVDGAQAAGPGAFTLTLTAGRLNDTCDSAAPLVLTDGRGVARGSTAAAAADFTSAVCPAGSAAGKDLFYSFTLLQAQDVRIDVDPAFGGAAAVLGRGECAGPPTVLGCGRGYTVQNLQPGTYRLAVDDLGQPGPFQVVVQLYPATDPHPPDPVAERCQQAGSLTFAAGRASVQGETGDDWSAFGPASCPPTGPKASPFAPEDAWLFSLLAPARLTASVQSDRPAVTYISSGPCRQSSFITCGHGAAPLSDVILPAGDHVLLVDGEQVEGPGRYTLEVQTAPFASGDTCAQAATLNLQAGALSWHGSTAAGFALPDFTDALCGATTAQGADAYHQLTLPERAVLDIELLATFDGVVALASGSCAGGLQVIGCGQSLTSRPLPPATYYLVVDGLGAAERGDYWLNLRATSAPASPLEIKCELAVSLTLVDGRAHAAGSSEGASAVLAPRSCANPGQAAESPELLYRFTLGSYSLLDVDVVAERSAVVYLAGGACTALQELACSGAGGSIRGLGLAPGTYHLVVDGAQAAGPGAFTLDLAVRRLNDRCAEAAPLAPADGRAVFSGSTAVAAADFTSPTCPAGSAAGRDLYYSFTLERLQDAWISLDEGFGGAVALLGPGACAQAPVLACGSSFRARNLLPGTYQLVVDDLGLAGGSFTGRLTLVDPTDPLYCAQDADCAAGRCVAQSCLVTCSEDADCPEEQVCNPYLGRCQLDLCLADFNCQNGTVCEAGRCILPDCTTHGGCAQVCVDRRCAARIPAACDADHPCPAPQSCYAPGACLLAGACAADADCPAATPFCVAGRCLVCRSDLDCARAEACWAGRCRFVDGCQQDGDCPGARTCAASSCLASACTGDLFDMIPPATPLTARTYTELQLCDGVSDTFPLALPAQTSLQLQLHYPPDEGDLSLALYPQGVATALGSSDQLSGVEVLGIQASAASRTFDVTVQGRPGFSPPYFLNVLHGAAAACTPDGYEGLLGNDTYQQAWLVDSPGQLSHRLCPQEQDWFTLPLATSRVTVKATPQSGLASVQLTLLDPDRQPLAQGAADGQGSLVATADIDTRGTYYVRLTSSAAAALESQLEVSVARRPDAPAQACNKPLTLQPGVPLTLPALLPVNCFGDGGGCLGQGVLDHVARFTLLKAARATIIAQGARPARMQLRSSCNNANSAVACGEQLTDVPLAAGTWYLVVALPAPGQPQLTATFVE